jgi:hypothetical protein
MRNRKAAVVAGIVAGVFATLVESMLWWFAGFPLPETLFRDARLAAAIVLGRPALVPHPTFDWRVMLTATLLHFSLSVAYAGCLSIVIARASWRASVAAGAIFGLALFAINMYGFTLIFPWFAVTRDWITAAAHVVFGVVAAAVCKATQMRRPETRR